MRVRTRVQEDELAITIKIRIGWGLIPLVMSCVRYIGLPLLRAPFMDEGDWPWWVYSGLDVVIVATILGIVYSQFRSIRNQVIKQLEVRLRDYDGHLNGFRSRLEVLEQKIIKGTSADDTD